MTRTETLQALRAEVAGIHAASRETSDTAPGSHPRQAARTRAAITARWGAAAWTGQDDAYPHMIWEVDGCRVVMLEGRFTVYLNTIAEDRAARARLVYPRHEGPSEEEMHERRQLGISAL